MVLKKILYRLVKAGNIDLLSKEQTEAYLESYRLASSSETYWLLPGVVNQADPTELLFQPEEAVTFPTYVWVYTPPQPLPRREGLKKRSTLSSSLRGRGWGRIFSDHFQVASQKTRQLPSGSILTNGRVLCTDFTSYHLAKNFLSRQQRTVYERNTLIAPWMHIIDGFAFGGYYDFVILIAAKLCRIKDAVPVSVFAEAVVSYPLFNTTYERELLALIGFEPDRILDSRLAAIHFEQCLLGNSGHWFYPNPADIRTLKKYIEQPLNIQRTAPYRMYVSRSGRRRVVNEDALITLLKRYDFLIVEDKPRTVAEQITLYKNASFIVGPHGASFTNIIWCEPGTHLLELLPAGLALGHFRYLSQLMGMSYSAYSHVIKVGNARHYLEEDIFVSIADLDRILSDLFHAV